MQPHESPGTSMTLKRFGSNSCGSRQAARHVSNSGKGIRSGYVRPYVLYYRYDGAHDIVYVLRILHGKTRYHARTF